MLLLLLLLLLLQLLLVETGFDVGTLPEADTDTGRDAVEVLCDEYAAPFNSASRQCANSKSLLQVNGGAGLAEAGTVDDEAAGAAVATAAPTCAVTGDWCFAWEGTATGATSFDDDAVNFNAAGARAGMGGCCTVRAAGRLPRCNEPPTSDGKRDDTCTAGTGGAVADTECCCDENDI
jgi:hypothetical protein